MRDDGRAGRWLKSCGDNRQSKSRPDSPVFVIGDLIRVFTEMPALRQCGSNMRPKALLEEGIVEVAPARSERLPGICDHQEVYGLAATPAPGAVEQRMP